MSPIYRLLEELASHQCPEADAEAAGNAPPRPISDLGFLSAHNRFRCGLCQEELRRFTRMRAHLERCRGGSIRSGTSQFLQLSFYTPGKKTLMNKKSSQTLFLNFKRVNFHF